jgi:hypothetical protein
MIRFIQKDQVPSERMRDVTYGSFTCDFRLNIKEKEHTRLKAGANQINYPDDCGTPMADMTLFKCLVNSIISTLGACCIMIDIKDFYLNSPMKFWEYMRLKESDIPEEIINEYNLHKKITDDKYVYCEIRKDMYRSLQAGSMAQELLETRLATHGYYQSKIIPGLWTHKTRPTVFTLVVDDFAIKVMFENSADHIINALKKDCTITVDREATKYIGLTIEWEYENRKNHIHMPGYLEKAFTRFKHEMQKKTQNSPHPHVKPKYGAKIQYAKDNNKSPPLSKEETNMFKQLQRHYCIMRGQSIQLFSWPSAQ